jgi:hypothetical protein
MPTSKVPARAWMTASAAAAVSPMPRLGRLGTAVVGALLKSKAPVKSPVTERRQAETLGASTPNRVSISRSTEVWSRAPEYRQPPALNGEISSAGVRKPRPTGPLTPPVPTAGC